METQFANDIFMHKTILNQKRQEYLKIFQSRFINQGTSGCLMQIIDFLEFNKVICLSQISHHFNDKILNKHRDWTKRPILKQSNLKADWERSLAFSIHEESSSIHLFDRKSLCWKKGYELNI